MARKEDRSNRWIKSERVGEVTLFRTSRSPYWQMYWTESVSGQHGPRIKQQQQSTRETDIGLARQVASRQSEALYRRKHYPERERERKRTPLRPIIEDFLQYLETLGRSHGHISKLKGRLHCLADWLEKRQVINVQDVNAALLRDFQSHLRSVRNVCPATVNHYVAGIHNFYGYAIYKRKLLDGPNPAATGRQAELDKLPTRSVPPPTIYPDQVNAVIEVARKHNDTQIANLIAFVCEGGFRFQELQFLQVGDINLEEREIILDVKKPDPHRVRAELRRTCLTAEGLWIPKTPAARRPIHITNRLARVIRRDGAWRRVGLGLHEPGRQPDLREQVAEPAEALRPGSEGARGYASANRQAVVVAQVALAAALSPHAGAREPNPSRGLKVGNGPRRRPDPRPLPWSGPVRVPRGV